MIDLEEAAKIAKQFIIDFKKSEPENLELVAISLSSDKENWQVTYRFTEKLQETNALQKAMGITEKKVYKKVTIDNTNKQIIGYSDVAYDKSEAA
jgi:hypothetical protein